MIELPENPFKDYQKTRTPEYIAEKYMESLKQTAKLSPSSPEYMAKFDNLLRDMDRLSSDKKAELMALLRKTERNYKNWTIHERFSAWREKKKGEKEKK